LVRRGSPTFAGKNNHLARSAVVIGASSGIGAAVAVELARRGYSVGIAARRVEALLEVAAQHPGITATIRLDLRDVAKARAAASDLIAKVGGVDVFIISAGTGSENPELEWGPEADTIAVNVTGFAAMATLALQHFVQRGRGHLVDCRDPRPRGSSFVRGFQGVCVELSAGPAAQVCQAAFARFCDGDSAWIRRNRHGEGRRFVLGCPSRCRGPSDRDGNRVTKGPRVCDEKVASHCSSTAALA